MPDDLRPIGHGAASVHCHCRETQRESRPFQKDQAAASVYPIFDNSAHSGTSGVTQTGNVTLTNLDLMPSFCGVKARAPDALTNIVALYGAVIDTGSVRAKYKEPAYLKTA